MFSRIISAQIFVLLVAVYFAGWTESQRILLKPDRKEVAVFVNQSYFVSCRANNSEQMKWMRAGGEIILETSGRVHVEDTKGDLGLDLVFEKARLKDKGDYTCLAQVDGQEVKATFSLVVYKPISFEDTPEIQHAPEGRDFTIRCKVGGDPKPSVSWRIKGKSLRSSPRHVASGDGLIISNVSLEDGGGYLCKATQYTSLLTDFKEKLVMLKVQHKPHWPLTQAKEAYGFVGGHVNITCSAVAEPGANFTWMKDNSIIEPNDDTQIFSSEHESTLQVHVYDESVFGAFVCKATNQFGTLERVIVLEKAAKPAIPTFRIKVARPDSMVLEMSEAEMLEQADQGPNSNAQGMMEITGYKVQYKLPEQDWTAAQEFEFDKETDGKGYLLTGLLRDTLYNVRVAAKTAGGYSDFSPEKSDRTKRVVPTPAPILETGTGQVARVSLTLISAALLAAHFYC